MEGWVSKKRPTGVGKFKLWQRRYLVLNSEHLSYFGENDRKKPKAQFRLNEIESVSLVVSEKKPDHTRFDIVWRPGVQGSGKGGDKDTMKRVYSFRAASVEDAKRWVSIITALAFGESIDANGDIVSPDASALLRGEPMSPRPAATSLPQEAANLREVICDRIYNALNIASILSPSAALNLDPDGDPMRGSKVLPSFLSNGGYLCANENSTEEHLKMMIYNELGSDTDLLRFLCGQFYTLLCSNNRDGYDSRSRAHSFSTSISQGEPSPVPPSSPSLGRGPAMKCTLKTCKNLRCRLPGFLGFRAALEPKPATPQQLFCTEHAELWLRTSQACARSLQSPLLGELLENPSDVLVNELISSLANGTPDAKGVACRLLWVVLPVYLEHKAKHKRRAHDKQARREERSGSEARSSSERAEESDTIDSARLSFSFPNSTHQRQASGSDFQTPRLSNSTGVQTSARTLPTDMAALEETSVVRTVALKTLPKQFAALMSQHCSGQEYSLPIKNALTSIMLRPSARMLKPEDLDVEEQAAMHMVVNHDGACWLAFMVALKAAPFNLREQALKEVNMLLIDNPGNCSNFKRQRNWPWLIYSLMSDIPSSILGQQTAEEHEELTKQRESGLLSNVPAPGREFPSLSFSLSSNSDDSNPPTPQVANSLPAPALTASGLPSPIIVPPPPPPPPLARSPSNPPPPPPPLVRSASNNNLPPPPPLPPAPASTAPTIVTPLNLSVIASPTSIAETPSPRTRTPTPTLTPTPTPPPGSTNTDTPASTGSEESKKTGSKFSFEQPLDQPKRGSLKTAVPPPPPPSLDKRGSLGGRRQSQPDDVVPPAGPESGLQPKRGSLKKRDEEGGSSSLLPPSSLTLPDSPNLIPLSISVTDLTPLYPTDELSANHSEIDQIDPDLIAVTHNACVEEAKCPTPKAAISINVTSNDNKGVLNSNNRRKGAVFVHKGTFPTGFRNRGVSPPSRYGTLSGAFAISRKGEEKNEAEEHNKLIVRVYTYSLNIMTILQYDSVIHSSPVHFRQLMLRCLNALLACTGEDKARTLMRPMFITLATKLGSKKVLDRHVLTSLAWQNLFPFFELVRAFLFQTFTFNILEEAKIRGSSHDRKRTMTRNPSVALAPSSSCASLLSSASILSSSSSSSPPRLPAPYAAWGQEEGFMVDLLPGVDVMADTEYRKVSTAGDSNAADDIPLLGFENGEYGFHLDAPGYFGDIALAERCSYLLRSKGLDQPVDESLPGVTSKDLVILREAHTWYEFFEDAAELLRMLPPPVTGEKGDVKNMSERLALFDAIMDAKTLRKFCEAPRDARRAMLKKSKEGPKPSRNPFASPRRSKNNIVIDLSGVK